MNIEKRKNNLIKKYGDEPTICFYYYCWNVVDYAGEKRVRETFKSIQGQGDEVVVSSYNTQDNTKELAEEYGLKFLEVEKHDHDVWDFPESKVRNKVIINTDCNFVIPLNINVEFVPNFDKKIIKWIKNHNIKNKMLRIRYKFENKNGKIGRQYGKSQVFYRPYLLEARGYDERTGFCTGSQRYGGLLMKKVFNLNKNNWDTKMYHKYHNDFKKPLLNKIYPDGKVATIKGVSEPKNRKFDRRITKKLHRLLKKDFDKNVEKVMNSYW